MIVSMGSKTVLSRSPRRVGQGLLSLTLALAMTAVHVGVSSAAPEVDPGAVELTLAPGESSTFTTNVTTPNIAPTPDIVFLADTTSSMDPVLANVRNNIGTIIDTVRAAQPDAQFAVAEYKEQNDGAEVFTVNTPLTDDDAWVLDGAQQWLYNVGGGGAPWTDFINAFHQIGTDAIEFRPGSSRIIAWFGDARSHDPSLGHTLANAVAALQGARVRVAAVPVLDTTGDDGLDSLGQASSITSATGGVLMPEQTVEQVSQAIVDGIHALNVAVRPQPECDPQLAMMFSPATRTVRSGTAASFDEDVNVLPDTAAGTYHCTVDFQVNDVSVDLTQTVTVQVLDDAPLPAVSIGDVSVTEGDTGTTPAELTVTLDAPSTTAVSVRWATGDGTATAPEDFTASSGEVTFAPGVTTTHVSVPIVGDTVDEDDETFTVELSEPDGAVIGDDSGVVTIVDDDRNGVFSCTASAVNLLGLQPSVANPANTPCKDDAKSVSSTSLGLLLRVEAGGLAAKTDQTPDDPSARAPAVGDGASATTAVGSIKISTLGLTIEVAGITSTASAQCVDGPDGAAPAFSGSSSIGSLKINGVTVPVGSEQVTIPLLLGSLTLNGTTTTGTSVAQRAVELHALLGDVVIADAQAGIQGSAAHPSGNPCAA